MENKRATLSFTLNGQKIIWAPTINDDWLDSVILSNFAKLLGRQKSGLRYTYLDLKGQDCLIGCTTPEQLASLRRATGLDFKWLT